MEVFIEIKTEIKNFMTMLCGKLDHLDKILMYLLHSLFHALISYIKYIKNQEIHFNFADIILLYYGFQYVSTIRLVIFGVNFENNNTIIIKKCLNHSTV